MAHLIDADALVGGTYYVSQNETFVGYTQQEIDRQPTVEMAEDCVKREDAQDIMARLLSDYLHDEDREKIENANAEIGELPSVTPQPKRGKWIEVEVHNCYATLKCSECDRVIEPTYTFGEYSYEDIKEFYPYCHCGARMDADMREVQDDQW